MTLFLGNFIIYQNSCILNGLDPKTVIFIFSFKQNIFFLEVSIENQEY